MTGRYPTAFEIGLDGKVKFAAVLMRIFFKFYASASATERPFLLFIFANNLAVLLHSVHHGLTLRTIFSEESPFGGLVACPRPRSSTIHKGGRGTVTSQDKREPMQEPPIGRPGKGPAKSGPVGPP